MATDMVDPQPRLVELLVRHVLLPRELLPQIEINSSDYRAQLMSWEAYAQQVETYCQQVGIAADPAQFTQDLRTKLAETIRTTDATFPTNTALTLRKGEPVLRRLKKHPEPEGFGLIDRLLSERIPACSIVDVLTDTEHWLHWTDAFGPLSGFASQLTSPRQRYVTTTFCYGCYLGPTQTVRSIPGLDRFQVAYVNQRHITEQKLLDATVGVINADFRGLKLTHNCANVPDEIRGSRKPHCEGFFP